MTNGAPDRAQPTPLSAPPATVTRQCGFPFTTTGRPCQNHVPAGASWCRAGHPCGGADSAEVPPDIAVTLLGAPASLGAPAVATLPATTCRPRSRRGAPRTRRAVELVRQAMASEDVEHLGLSADHVLGDGGAAVALLGSPHASPAARAAVVQRFGRVGALLVIGYEDRWGRVRLRDLSGRASVDGGAHRATAPAAESDPEGGRAIEVLVREFPHADAHRLYDLLSDIDRHDLPAGHHAGVAAHRWLDATYAVAARDGTASAHRAYMRALDRVMRLVRPLVAS